MTDSPSRFLENMEEKNNEKTFRIYREEEEQEGGDGKRGQTIAFFGRPNAGKSSCANRLFGVKLRVGKTPGSTRSIRIVKKGGTIIADLPGWGLVKYGKKGATDRAKRKILQFFEENSGLIDVLVIVIDMTTFSEVKRNLEKKGYIPIEVDAIKSFNSHVRKVVILANKADKLKPREREEVLKDIKGTLMEYLGITLPIIVCSAKRDPPAYFQQIKQELLTIE